MAREIASFTRVASIFWTGLLLSRVEPQYRRCELIKNSLSHSTPWIINYQIVKKINKKTITFSVWRRVLGCVVHVESLLNLDLLNKLQIKLDLGIVLNEAILFGTFELCLLPIVLIINQFERREWEVKLREKGKRSGFALRQENGIVTVINYLSCDWAKLKYNRC